MDYDIDKLIQSAFAAKDKAYVPYSGFGVGAALLSVGGKIYTGCNIENAAFSPTNCAERTAFFKAVSEGEKDFVAIVICGGGSYCPPCGVCRQVMLEFCAPDTFDVILAASPTDYRIFKLAELMPHSFGKQNL